VDDVVITDADPAESDAVADLWVTLAEGQRDHGSHLESRANRTHIREAIVRAIAADRLLVARADDIVGFVMFGTETTRYEQTVSRGIVENIYVVSDRRNEGIGSALLEAAEDRLREQGVDAIALEAMAHNERAREFYRQRGYTPHRVELEKRLD
jgi:ribosomal protein S18 acetylase RimI-like enzyme